MRHKSFIATVLMLVFFASCKTSEGNYREAYEMAKNKQMDGVDEDTYSLIKKESMPQQTTIAGDTIRVIDANVKPQEKGTSLYKYNVVANGFRQVFNAKAMCTRLADAGYGAYIVYDAEPLYYVVAAGTDNEEEAKSMIRKLSEDKRFVLKNPYPCILRPVNKR